jgi:signal transduction histidine kinase
MTPIPVPHRWLAALLGVVVLLDLLLILREGHSAGLLLLPGAVAMALCAYFGVDRPEIFAPVGAAVLTATSIPIGAYDIVVPSVGIDNVMLTELVSGTVLTVLVVWRCAPLVGTACTTALVAACFAAIIVREPGCYYAEYCGYDLGLQTSADIALSGVLGFFLLIGSVGAGLYLRRSARQRVETEMGALVRTQWPLGAALAIIGMLQLAQQGAAGALEIAGAVVASVCAFFGPKYPLRNSIVAAVAIALASLVSNGLFGVNDAMPISFTALAASMALVAFAVRQLPVKTAALATGALVAGMVVSLGARSRSILDDSSTSLVLLFLLGVSIAAGWYFRARDRERNQTVRAAVTSAQQGERMALARELHDVVAHHVTGIVVQAQAALLVVEKNPGVAVTALEKIEYSGTEALTAMRTLVGSLRDGTAMAGSADSTGQATTDVAADIRAVVDNFVGPPVSLDLSLPDQLPVEVGRSVLRLVQESLTNVGKHAPNADDVQVRVVALGEELHIRVVDNGSGRPLSPVGGSGGYGLVGMRERVELLGGRFEAGPSGFVGWSVEAWLPLTK